MAEETCPSCHAPLPSALGQHAANVEIGLVTCPSCGEGATMRKGSEDAGSADFEKAEAAPPGRTEGRDTFSGSDTVAGVREELQE